MLSSTVLIILIKSIDNACLKKFQTGMGKSLVFVGAADTNLPPLFFI
ncbi:hypothetical protein HMPREF9370_2546 [Neisseria wadsworthii 9715]|uniref:Uncharacterized protein n=1 Tax=Neisseria wadsworthii 9715 TaxID=1030841 RepID=G4CTY6_9NEIS|nr:hypothetical protein HMPREF9370_2546 [Neisseria wadsworthii 9715]